MNRRSILRLGGLALAGSVAGCSGVSPTEPDAVSVSELTVRNLLEREVDVDVLLLDAGEIVLWRTVTVPAGESPFATLDDVPDAPGEYSLYAQVPTTDADRPVRDDLAKAAGDRSCVAVLVEVVADRSDAEEHPAVTLDSVGDCRDSG